MLVIGLTGPTGAGKGQVGEFFKQIGIDVIDTDAVSRAVCARGSDCLNELVDAFSDCILFDNGELNRKKLASIAFSDKEKLSVLNSITHRYILLEVDKWLSEQENAGKFAAIIDAPVLFESKFDSKCDIIISVIADCSTRKKRIISRDGLTDEQAEKRMANQHSDDFYTTKSHFVITNDDSLTSVQKQVNDIYKKIKEIEQK